MTLFNTHIHPSSRRPQDSLLHRISNDPYLDWRIMVVVAVVCAGIVIGLGLVSYERVAARLSAPAASDTATRPLLFDVNSMSKILDTFAARAGEQSVLMKGYSGVADPSL